MHPKKKPRVIHYVTIYNIATGSYWVNKSQRPNITARHQFARAYKDDRPDYDSPFSRDIREYGEEGFLVRYSLELPEFADCRAHYVVKKAPDPAIRAYVEGMRTTPIEDPDEVKAANAQRKAEKKAREEAIQRQKKQAEQNEPFV